jgi:dolichyl-phosphate-mannose-protein mannosyltransferase
MQAPAPSPSQDRPPSWPEPALVAMATLAGAVLRCWDLGRLGLDHFDEGIYALAGLWFTSPRGLSGIDPGLIPYAPPGYPILVGLADMALGVGDTPAILVSIAAGTATIPVAAWLGRRTFGPGAGAASAWLAALSGTHVAFSRMALTDATFLLTFLVALGLGMRFLERPGVGRALLFGLAVGLAQNLKYNGFLAGIIVAGAWSLGLLRAENWRRGPLLRTLSLGLLAATLAALCYLPWYRFVESHGRYADLLRHQRSYTHGLASWPDHWRQQLAQATALAGLVSGRWTWAGPAALLAVLSATAGRRSVEARSRWMRVVILALIAAAILGVMPAMAWWLALVAAPSLLRSARPGHRVVAVGWIGLSMLTPFYHPYARLWLPVEALEWLLVGGLAVRLAGVAALPSRSWGQALGGWRRARLPIAALLVALVGSWWTTFGGRSPPVVWPWLLMPSDGLRREGQALSRMVKRMLPTRPARVLGRPALLFYLGLDGVAVERARDAKALGPAGQAGPPAWTLLDEAQLRQESADQWPRGYLYTDSDHRHPPTGPTLLDLDPGAAFGRTDVGQYPTDSGAPYVTSWVPGLGPPERPTLRLWLRLPTP